MTEQDNLNHRMFVRLSGALAGGEFCNSWRHTESEMNRAFWDAFMSDRPTFRLEPSPSVSASITGWLIGVMLLGSLGAQAANRPFVDEYEAPPPPGMMDTAKWIEQLPDLPPYPRDEDLLSFELGVADPQFTYALDGRTLSIGEDKAVRYVLVVAARSGQARNLYFEGIRCGALEYKTYAYGTAGKTWQTTKRSEWAKISREPGNRLRYDLSNLYLCDLNLGQPYELSEIKRRLRSKGTFDVHNFLDDR